MVGRNKHLTKRNRKRKSKSKSKRLQFEIPRWLKPDFAAVNWARVATAGAVLPMALPALTRAASPNETLRLASVGTQRRAKANIVAAAKAGPVKFAAFADVDAVIAMVMFMLAFGMARAGGWIGG